MASSSAGPSMSTPLVAPFTPPVTSSPFMQQHARPTSKPLRSSPLAGPVLSRSPSQFRMQKESEASAPSELNETERMIALNVHGAFDSQDALKAAFLVPPRPAHIRGSHSRSLQDVSRLRPRPVSLHSAPAMRMHTVRNHRRSFIGLDAERARDVEEQVLRLGDHSLSALGEAEGQDQDQAHEESEEDWSPGRAGADAKSNFDHNSLPMKMKKSRTDMKLPTQARPKSILLSPPSSPSLSQSIYSYSPSLSPSLSSSSSLPASPNSTSTSLSGYSASPRSSTSFLSLPPTSPTGDAVWLTQNTYSETPKFTRLGLGAPGVVMPVSARTKAHSRPPKTGSSPAATPSTTSNEVPEPQARVPAASATLSKRNSFMATFSASIGRQRSLSSSSAMLHIAEHGQQQAGQTSRIVSSATPTSVPSGNINSNYDPPRGYVEPKNEAMTPPANGSAPHTNAVAAPLQATSCAAPPKSTDSTSSLSLASSNSQSQSQTSSEISSPTCSSLPPSPTPSLTRSGSASSSASSLPIHTPPPEAEISTLPSLSRLKETTRVEEAAPRLSIEALAVTITDVDVARALENAQRADALNNNLASSRRRSRLGLGLGRGLERMKSWTSSPTPSRKIDTTSRNTADTSATTPVSASTSTPNLVPTPPVHSVYPASETTDSTTDVPARSSCGSNLVVTVPPTSGSWSSATMETGIQLPLPLAHAPPPLVPEVEAVSSNSGSGSEAEDSTRREKPIRPFSQALVEEEESSGEEEALNNRAPCRDVNASIEAGKTGDGNHVQQHGGSDSCHVRTRTWSTYKFLRHTPASEQAKPKSSPIPRSLSETAILGGGGSKKLRKAHLATSEKGHGRRGSVRRIWDALVHRDSTKRTGQS